MLNACLLCLYALICKLETTSYHGPKPLRINAPWDPYTSFTRTGIALYSPTQLSDLGGIFAMQSIRYDCDIPSFSRAILKIDAVRSLAVQQDCHSDWIMKRWSSREPIDLFICLTEED